eukprot:tig00021221_g19342.t1
MEPEAYSLVASACGVLAACSKDGRLAEADASLVVDKNHVKDDPLMELQKLQMQQTRECMRLGDSSLLPADLAAFKSANLRKAKFSVSSDTCITERLQALEKAIAGCPKLESLELHLRHNLPNGPGPIGGVEVDATATASLFLACNRILTGLTLSLERPLDASEAEAIAACAKLSTLELRCIIHSIPEIRPLQRLSSSACARSSTLKSALLAVRVEGQDELEGYTRVVQQLMEDAWPAARVTVSKLERRRYRY